MLARFGVLKKQQLFCRGYCTLHFYHRASLYSAIPGTPAMRFPATGSEEIQL